MIHVRGGQRDGRTPRRRRSSGPTCTPSASAPEDSRLSDMSHSRMKQAPSLAGPGGAALTRHSLSILSGLIFFFFAVHSGGGGKDLVWPHCRAGLIERTFNRRDARDGQFAVGKRVEGRVLGSGPPGQTVWAMAAPRQSAFYADEWKIVLTLNRPRAVQLEFRNDGKSLLQLWVLNAFDVLRGIPSFRTRRQQSISVKDGI